jgi:hypothetical protein
MTKAKRTKRKLTEAEWSRVFDIRCKTKRGERVSDDDMTLVMQAFAEDAKRYENLSSRVYEATKPFGTDWGHK